MCIYTHTHTRAVMYGYTWLDSITDSMQMNLSKPWEIVKDREVWRGVAKSPT